MAEKVKGILLLVNQRIINPKNGSYQPALLKGIIFGLSVLVLELYKFPWFLSVGFVILAIILYFSPLFNARRLFFAFLILVFLTFLIPSKFAINFSQEASMYPQIAFGAFFGFLFYLLIGIKQLIFINRKNAYYFLYLSILYQGFLLYFAAEKIYTLSDFYKTTLLILFLFAIIREFFRINKHPKSRLFTATVFVLVLINLEIAWAINLLTIEFTSAASLATLFGFISTEAMRRYLQEELNAKFLRYSMVSFLILSIVILLFSSWGP